MDIDLNRFFDLIVLAKNSDYYSKKELDLFYDIWKIEYEKRLKLQKWDKNIDKMKKRFVSTL